MHIETERLIIRDFMYSDRADLLEYMLQRVDKEFEGYPDFSEEKLDDELAMRCSNDEFLAIELKSDAKVIGNIYLGKREFQTRELGFVLNERFLRQGYGSEAASAVITWAFSNGVRRIYAECTPLNTASWKTMEKLGLQREAEFRKNVSFHTDTEGHPIYWDTYVYAALSEDFCAGHKELLVDHEQTRAENATAFDLIFAVVKRIPKGKVASYGQVAALAGNRHWARVVGFALHANPDPNTIPCHRVVTKEGNVSNAFAFGGENEQIKLLTEEGIEFVDGHVDMKRFSWK